MAVDLEFSVASGAAVAKKTAVHITATGLDSNAVDGTEQRFYIQGELAGTDSVRSLVFSPSSTGTWRWDGLIFPADGAWDVHVYDASDDSSQHNETYTVA